MFEAVERRMLRAMGQIVLTSAAIGLLIWAASVPGNSLTQCGINADEPTAIAILKNIRHCQLEFRSRAAIDRDGDAGGEFGWFAELAAVAPLRGSDPVQLLDPPALSSIFGRLESGRLRRCGYLFQLWLPAAGGTWLREGAEGEVDPAAAETNFVVYAWPDGTSVGRRVFFVDATGHVFASGNEIGYVGIERPVPVDAALPSSDATAERVVGARRGRDGGEWFVVQ